VGGRVAGIVEPDPNSVRAPPLLPLQTSQSIEVNTAAPLSRWLKMKMFSTQKECEAYQIAEPHALPWYVRLGGGYCVSTDDPRLKEK
jgi:hypothetical protein